MTPQGQEDMSQPLPPLEAGKPKQLSAEERDLFASAATNVIKMHLRAEARAQATVAKKELAEQFNAVIEDERERAAEKIGRLGEAVARLTVIVEVLTDLLVDDGSLAYLVSRGDGQPGGLTEAQRRDKFKQLVSQKRRAFEAQA